MDVQQLYRLHLMAGSGALVEVLEGGKVKRGKWLVSKDDCLVADAVQAEVKVFLDTGIHTFTSFQAGGERSVQGSQAGSRAYIPQKRKAVRVPVSGELTYRCAAEVELAVGERVEVGFEEAP